MMNEVMDAKECAAYLRSSYFNLVRKAKAGEIPCFRMGRRVLFRKSSVDAWIEAQEKGTSLVDEAPLRGVLRKIN